MDKRELLMSLRVITLVALLVCPLFASPAPQAVPVTDLGTLGGRFGATNPEAINDSGFIAGTTDTPNAMRHAFRRSPDGTMIDLGTLGGKFSDAIAINSAGWVVGSSTIAVDNDEDSHAFLWRPGIGKTDLGTLPGLAQGQYSARDVNDAGVVVGQFYGPEPDYAYKAWTWSVADPVMRELPGLSGGGTTEVYDVNEMGQAVGLSTNADGFTRAVLWSPSREVSDLGHIGDGYSYAYAINDAGHVVGAGSIQGQGDHGFLWKDGTMTDLGVLTGDYGNSSANAINAAGLIVGTSVNADGQTRAVRWTAPGQIEDLGALEVAGTSEAKRINDAGRIVGFATVGAQTHAFVWDPGQGMRDLGILAEGWSSWGVDVNNPGTILGYGENGFGHTRGFVSTGTGALQDLGSLGGGRSRAFALNDQSQVVGDSFASSGYFHAFSWTAQGGMVDLGTVGNRHARAIDVNNQGEVVANSGWYEGFEDGPFYWSLAHGKHVIPGFGNEVRFWASDINNEGKVCGTSVFPDGSARAWIWTRQGGIVALGPLTEGSTSAAAINDHGHVTGSRSLPSGEVRGFLWKPGAGFKDLGTLGGSYTSPLELNERGDVAGIGTDADGALQVFLWKGHTQVVGPLGGLGLPSELTHDLNWNRTVVGRALTIEGQIHAFAGSSAPLRDLGTLDPAHAYSDALAINDSEEIVGVSSETDSERSNARAFLVRGQAAMIDLGTLGGPSAEAMDINAAGKVAGQSQLPNGELHAALWTTR